MRMKTTSFTNRALGRRLETRLNAALEDERQANMMYHDLAGTASMLGLDDLADKLRKIADQETAHFNELVAFKKSDIWRVKKEVWRI